MTQLPAVRARARAAVLIACAVLGACERAGSTAAVDSGYVGVTDGRLYYEQRGSGSTVILLHGGNLDRRMWDPQFELLARTNRVIRYDARGYGKSSPADAPFAAHDDLKALMDTLRIPRATLVGLSMGGRIAIDFTLAHPGMVDRLVLAAPGISGGTWPDDGDTLWLRKAQQLGLAGDSLAVARAWLESAYIRTALHPAAQAAWVQGIVEDQSRYWMGLVRHQDLEREAVPAAAGMLAGLAPPILLLVGAEDTRFIHAVADSIAARAPQVRRVDIPGAGHMLNLEATERFDTLLLQFLAVPRN